MWINAGHGVSCVDAWDCAQAIIPTDLKQLARMDVMQFGVYTCADRIFMLADMHYNQRTGAILKASEGALFSDNGVVSYFIRQYADQFGYEVQGRGTSLDGSERMFNLKRVRVQSLEEVQLMDLEHLTEHIRHNAGFYPGTQEVTEHLLEYINQRHEQVHTLASPAPGEQPLYALP